MFVQRFTGVDQRDLALYENVQEPGRLAIPYLAPSLAPVSID